MKTNKLWHHLLTMLCSNLRAELLCKPHKVTERFIMRMKRGKVQFKVEASLVTSDLNPTVQMLTSLQ